MNIKQTLLLITCCAMIAACSPEMVETELEGSIKGSIINADTGERISGASIETTPATEALVSDGSGNFQFRNVPTGSYQVKASKPDFQTKSVMVMVNESKTSNATIQLLPAEKAATRYLRADVTSWDQTGNPDSSFVNVEYRFNNTSDGQSIGEFEVYFDIYTDKETYLFEVNSTELEAGEQNIGSFEKYVRDRLVDSVAISGMWVKE